MAGRNKKISTLELYQIIDPYIKQNPFLQLIPNQLATYARKNGYPNINYRDFTRNREIMAYIYDYNQSLTKGLETEEYLASIYNTTDAEEFLLKNNTHEKLVKAIQYIDIISNKNAHTLQEQIEINTNLQAENEKLRQEITKKEKEIESLSNRQKRDEVLESHLHFLTDWIDRNISQETALSILRRRHQELTPTSPKEATLPVSQERLLKQLSKNTHRGTVKSSKVPFRFSELPADKKNVSEEDEAAIEINTDTSLDALFQAIEEI